MRISRPPALSSARRRAPAFLRETLRPLVCGSRCCLPRTPRRSDESIGTTAATTQPARSRHSPFSRCSSFKDRIGSSGGTCDCLLHLNLAWPREKPQPRSWGGLPSREHCRHHHTRFEQQPQPLQIGRLGTKRRAFARAAVPARPQSACRVRPPPEADAVLAEE